MFLGRAGLAMDFNSAWILATLAPFYFVIRFSVIAREEAYFERSLVRSISPTSPAFAAGCKGQAGEVRLIKPGAPPEQADTWLQALKNSCHRYGHGVAAAGFEVDSVCQRGAPDSIKLRTQIAL